MSTKYSMFSDKELDAYKRKEATAIIQAQKGYGDVNPIINLWRAKRADFLSRCHELKA